MSRFVCTVCVHYSFTVWRNLRVKGHIFANTAVEFMSLFTLSISVHLPSYGELLLVLLVLLITPTFFFFFLRSLVKSLSSSQSWSSPGWSSSLCSCSVMSRCAPTCPSTSPMTLPSLLSWLSSPCPVDTLFVSPCPTRHSELKLNLHSTKLHLFLNQCHCRFWNIQYVTFWQWQQSQVLL